ncbi:MAG: hypothetical protein ACREP7_02745 [Lysobacter sp.]
MPWILAMAAICMSGIVGMLLADGVADVGFFALAALPLAVGLWRWNVHRRRH